jgi:hypothetical protein
MGIIITKNFGPLEHEEWITPEDMREVGLLARELMIRRTLQGVDVNGQAFQAYSPRYADAKGKALGGAAHVNLQVSGAMLNDLTIIRVQGWPEPLVELGWTK